MEIRVGEWLKESINPIWRVVCKTLTESSKMSRTFSKDASLSAASSHPFLPQSIGSISSSAGPTCSQWTGEGSNLECDLVGERLHS